MKAQVKTQIKQALHIKAFPYADKFSCHLVQVNESLNGAFRWDVDEILENLLRASLA